MKFRVESPGLTARRISSRSAVILLLVVIWAQPLSANEPTPSLDEMWGVIQNQQAEIETLKRQNAQLLEKLANPASHSPEASMAATNADTHSEASFNPGPVDTEDQSTRMSIYGAAMLDTGYQSGQNDPDWFDVVRPTKLPAYANEYGADGKYFSGVRQSRLGFQSWTPTDLGELHTIFEFELFGTGDDAGQTTFRLRHAWGEIGQLGAGQTWSPFMDPDVFPNSIEYWGPNAMVFFRNVQLRWTPWQDGNSNFMLALEKPGGSGDRGKYADRIELDGVKANFPLPDLSAHYRLSRDWGHVQLAGIVRRIEWDDLEADQFDLSGKETGWGLNLSSNLKLGQHVARMSLVYGEGVQNYMNDAPVDIGIRENFSDPMRPIEGTALPLFGLVAFLDLNWSETWTSTVGYSMLDIDNSSGQSADAFSKGQYALANILYHPTGSLFLGPEIQWAKRDNYQDGFSSDDLRVQFSVKYSFNKNFGGK